MISLLSAQWACRLSMECNWNPFAARTHLVISGNFKPQILVAMPSLQDGYFDKSVIYLCDYNASGAMGFVVNSPSSTTVDELLSELGMKSFEEQKKQILIGGPVQPELCWVVHSSDYECSSSTTLGDDLAISAAQEVLTGIADGNAPNEYILGVGYAGWGPGQLDREIEEDAWWLAEMNLRSVLEHSHESRWDAVMNHLGLTSESAHCYKV
ncbi:MAG: YqgE/AlgH family protein [SAR324 cluster bacterium]|nr:YqgE/AlgH family protein [SAR324 cluster bacterium]